MEQNLPLLKMVNICKKFGVVRALENVSLDVDRGEIVGLLGDNGAGKSTLIKILTGVFPATSGEIYFEGEKICFASPQEARKMGIETVYQDLSLIDLMTISRNFFLGREPVRKKGLFTWLDRKKINKDCRVILENIGIRVRSPEEYVSVLSGGERQAISIGRCMYFNAKLIILDEPLTALSVKESRKALKYIEEAGDSGVSVIFITHNVHHVYPVSDRFVILDKGVKIGELDKKEVAAEDIIEIIARGRV